jgi:predicted nucleic-acid-binding protein
VIAVDTNVLVRILVDEPSQPVQVTAARALASDAGAVFVPLVVLVETVWVLESAYGLPKSDVVQALDHLLANAAFTLEEEQRCNAALHLFRESGAELSDCVILADCHARELPLYTFDKRLAKLVGAEPVVGDEGR